MQRNKEWHLERKRLIADNGLLLGSWIDHFGNTLEASLDLFSASEKKANSIYLWPQVLTPPSRTVVVGAQIIGCWLSGGWTIGVVGNNPHLVPYLASTLSTLGYHELSALSENLQSMFPAHTPFGGSDGNHMTEILNRLEKDQAYLELLVQADTTSERDWGYEDQTAFQSIVSYAQANRDSAVWLLERL